MDRQTRPNLRRQPCYAQRTRYRDTVLKCYLARNNYGFVKACCETMLCNLMLRAPKTNFTAIAGDLVDTITSNISYFLRDKTKVMQM